MKKSIIIIIIAFHTSLFTLHAIAQGDWYPLHPNPTSNHLKGICFVDDLNGWAVGEKGTILNTSDGGESWEYQQSGTLLSLRSVFFTDAQNGWIVGGNTHPIPGEYIILHTSDGGYTWVEQAAASTGCLRDVFFVDNNYGWAFGDQNHIFSTSDGGGNWTAQISGVGYSYGWEVFFTDSLRGWTACSNGLQSTNDGGLNWNVKIEGNFKSIFFIDEKVGWASSSGSIGTVIHTTDAFETWDTINTCYNLIIPGYSSSCGFYSLFFKDTNTGWALYYSCSSGGWISGCGYNLIKTNDGGNSWETIDLPVDLPFSNGNYSQLCFSSQGNGCIVGSHGIVLTSIHWEDEWVERSHGNCFYLKTIVFTDNLNGWTAGHNSYYGFVNSTDTTSVMMHTADGGLYWEEIDHPVTGMINSISYLNNDKLWAVGYNGNYSSSCEAVIIHSKNGGMDWEIQHQESGYSLNDVQFINGESGWAVGRYYDEGKIFKSDDGGDTWELQSDDSCQGLSGVYFADPDHGWAVGSTIYATIDGGRHWLEQQYDTSGLSLESVFFLNPSEGWVVGKRIILHTVDGGENWSFELHDHQLYSIHFKDEDHGLISGSGGIVLFTQDGGITWQEMETGTDHGLNAVFYTPNGQAYAAGDWGTIVKSDLLTASVEKPKFNTQHSTFNIQTYPNPTSGISHFAFYISQYQWVSLKIYDLLGREVATVLDEMMPAGEHVVRYDMTGLPAGVYFVELRAKGIGLRAVSKLVVL